MMKTNVSPDQRLPILLKSNEEKRMETGMQITYPITSCAIDSRTEEKMETNVNSGCCKRCGRTTNPYIKNRIGNKHNVVKKCFITALIQHSVRVEDQCMLNVHQAYLDFDC